MPKRSGKKIDEDVELSVVSPMMGSKANGSKKGETPLNNKNKQNGAKTRKHVDNSAKTKNSNRTNSAKGNNTVNKTYSKDENRQNVSKKNDANRKHLAGKSNGTQNGDRRNGAKKESDDPNSPMMTTTKENDHKSRTVDENDNSTKRKHKRMFLICLFILILVLVLSILIAVIVWKFVIDTGPSNTIHEGGGNKTSENTVIQLDFAIHLNRSYTGELADEISAAYKDLSRQFVTEINYLYESGELSESYMYTVVNEFRPGSVVVYSSSFFSNKISSSADSDVTEEEFLNALKSDAENQLLEGVRENEVLGPLADDVQNAVQVKQPIIVDKSTIKNNDAPGIHQDVTKPKATEMVSTEGISTVATSTLAAISIFSEKTVTESRTHTPETEKSSMICGIQPGMRRRRKRIVGGHDSPFGSMPWIGSVKKQPDGHYCAATLVNEQWAITAAHCLGNTDGVVFGDLNLEWASDYHEQVNLSAVFPHPDYDFFADRADKPNDIALLRLSRPVKITPATRPACIATNDNEMQEYRQCKAAGWGISDYRSTNTNRLQEVLLPLVPQNDCRTFYADSPLLLPEHDEGDESSLSLSSGDAYDVGVHHQHILSNRSVVSDRMICAGGYPEGGKGVCRADNGGPLVCLGKDDLWYLVGVGSWSWGCDLPNIPNVFARVSVFHDFIENTITKTEECVKDDSKTSCFEGCVGGEDCLKQCGPDDFHCQAGYCIPGDQACNDRVDCADGSDERGYARCLDECGESDLIINTGIHSMIQSPDYPRPYPDFHRCQWHLTASNGGRLLVNFTHFDLEMDYDFLHVAVGLQDSDYLFSLTGSERQLDLISPGSTLVLTFSSDVSTGLTGFSLIVTEISITDFDSCNNGVQVVPVDRDIFCNYFVDCADSSDEPPTCFNRGSRALCGRSSVQVSANFPANISYSDYTNSAQCEWIVNAALPTARLRVKFHRFELENNYDYLEIRESSVDESPKLSYTGHRIPPNIVSSGPSLVVVFETDDTGVDSGFLMQVSFVAEDDEALEELHFCANGMEVLSQDELCNGQYECQDSSDEQPGCECGETLHIIPTDGTISLTSYKYPQNYHQSTTCQWTIISQSGGKITATFNDFSLEENYDFLHMGTEGDPKLISLTGSKLPLDVVSPINILVITFESDRNISDRGFSVVLSDNVSTDNLRFCDNGLEVVTSDGKERQKCHN
ncbi:uncharacterized protein [Amphiura filiformis]|uniref:uncharacterized protein isoform X2 n=1 Tax=Amphiura filiformis TaxID=82378 RepID=UPI003B219616